MPAKDVKALLDTLQFQISAGVVSSPMEDANLHSPCYITETRKGLINYLGLDKKVKITPNKQQTQTSTNKGLNPHNSQACPDQDQDFKVREGLKNISSLQELKNFALDFEGCELKKTAINTVFSDGAANAKIMLIGEAPGETEDETGIPFCGRSGALLDRALEAAGFSRKTNLYITNTIFWRPPGNRKPTEGEMKICRPIVEKHIALIGPKIIILCGSTAVESLLNKQGITKMNGTFTSYSNQYTQESIIAAPIFHPSFLLRNPIAKKQVWLALLRIKQKYQELVAL